MDLLLNYFTNDIFNSLCELHNLPIFFVYFSLGSFYFRLFHDIIVRYVRYKNRFIIFIWRN